MSDLISRETLINTKPEFMNEQVVRDTKYRTTKDRIYAKAWNVCNSYWLNIIDNAMTEPNRFDEGYALGYKDGQNRPHGEWLVTEAYPHKVYCSECYKTYAQENWEVWKDGSLPRDYCPNCGAKMDGGEQ